MTEKEKIKPKIKKKRKPYDLAEEIKELANWEETGYKILVEIISGFKYAVKIKIDPSLIDEKLVQLIDKDEDIVFILLIKYNHPYVAPFLLCLTKFSVPELSDGRDLIEEVLNSPWPIKEKKMLKKVIKLIPGFINNYLKNVTVEKNIKITGKYYLDSTYELNILNLIPHLFFGDIFEIVALGNDKRVFDDKRILMITEGFILLFVEKSVFEIQKLKLIFWGPIDSLSIIKQINGRNVIELKWKAKKDKTTLMRLKTDKSQQIFDILMESLNKKKIEYKIANESSGAKKGEISEIQKNVSNELEKIKDSEKEHKAELESIKIEHTNEIKMNDNEKCYLIQISTQNLAGFKKIHSLLTQKFEEHLSEHVVLIPKRKRVNGKEYRAYISKKVPRDKTLTAVFDGYLDDILYPATIVGKRVRYPVGKTRIYKVIVDPLDKEVIESKIPALIACYKGITNRILEIEFQK